MTKPLYTVPTADIALLPEYQVRSDVDGDRVMRYSQIITEAREAGEKNPFPPIELFKIVDPVIGEMLVLVDGFHRHMGAVDAGETEHLAHVTEGTREEAMLAAMFANYEHEENGVALKRSERQRAFRKLAEIKKDEIEADPTLLTKLAMEISGMSLATAKRDSQVVRKEITERLKRERDARIVELSEEGKSVREIAEEVGVGVGTVSRVTNSVPQSSSEPDGTPEQPEANDDEITFTGFDDEDIDEIEVINPVDEINANLAKREQKEKEVAQEDTTTPSNHSISGDDSVNEAKSLNDYSPEELAAHLSKRIDAVGILKVLQVAEKNAVLDSALCKLHVQLDSFVNARG